MTPKPFYSKAGDTKPIRHVLERYTSGAWAAVDLTGASVRFLLATPAGVRVVAGTATIVGSATAGTVEYGWAQGGHTQAGEFQGEWEVTFSNGVIESFPADSYAPVVFLEQLG